MLYAALSCLQGRPAAAAATELARYADGIQLTPGCAPCDNLDDVLADIPTRTHHGHSFTAMRRRIWDADGNLANTADSIHPPKTAHRDRYFEQFDNGDLADICIEVMYPGYVTGNTADIDAHMAAHHPLAVDISHLYLQQTAGSISDRCLHQLLDYDHITEIHISANDGRRDSHATIDADTWGLHWAAERLADGTPTIIESYLHHRNHTERAAQFELIRELL